MPRAVAAIRDRGNNEPYSDTNAPSSLEMTQQTSTPAAPPAGEVILQVPSGGTTLTLTNPAGVVTTFTGGGGAVSLGSNFTNRQYGFGTYASNVFAQFQQLYHAIPIGASATLTGIRFKKGTQTTINSQVMLGLYNAAGTRIAVTAAQTLGLTSGTVFSTPFTATVNVTPGVYWLMIVGSANTSAVYGAPAGDYLGPVFSQTGSTFTAPTTFTPPALTAYSGVMGMYLTTY